MRVQEREGKKPMAERGRHAMAIKVIAALCALVVAGIMCAVSVVPNLGNLTADALADKPVKIAEDVFPDNAFRNYVLENIDTNKDGYLAREEREGVRNIGDFVYHDGDSDIEVTDSGLADLGVGSLEGIDNFPNLVSIEASGNSVTRIDISGNANLTRIDLRNNHIREIDSSSANDGAQVILSAIYQDTFDGGGNLDIQQL